MKRSAAFLMSLVVFGPSLSAQTQGDELAQDVVVRGTTDGRPLGTPLWRSAKEVSAVSADSGPAWLVFDRSYQDISVEGEFRCQGACRLGVLLRAEPLAGGGLSGVLVPVGDAGRGAERVTISADGEITARTPLPVGSAQRRLAKAPPAGTSSVPPPRPVPTAQTTVPSAKFPPPEIAPRKGDWNTLAVQFDANVVRVAVNGERTGAWVADADGFGVTALLVEQGASGEFRKLVIRDLAHRGRTAEFVSDRFRKQVLHDFFYSWGAGAGDINRDGVIDIVSGPFIYYGPDFRRFREFSLAEPANPVTDYPKFFEQYVADFTGDGWPDILAVRHAPPYGQLYVNPKGQHRRWEVATVIDRVTTEKTALADIDGDGMPELIFTVPGELRAARPNPARPTDPWTVETLSTEGIGSGGSHGMGVGDLTGDGQPEILSRFGWWERAASSGQEWVYHRYFFGRNGPAGSGGAEMSVYDVNGDGLNDVVSALTAHGYGLAWFEQKRDHEGRIRFVRHLIMDGPEGVNAGEVVFSQPHATKAVDIDGDGILDLVTGKRYFSHTEAIGDPDTWGEPVLYWYKAIRDPKAPGGARFEPHLIDNRSGVGSDILAADLDGDGQVDLGIATRFGMAIFWNQSKVRR